MKFTDLQIKILFPKCETEQMKKLIVAYTAPLKNCLKDWVLSALANVKTGG